MNTEIRNLFHELIEVVNKYNLPWEVRRIVVENVLYMTEKKADEAIMQENNEEDSQCKNPIQE